ncbi:outer membrane protein assembly factor BamE [Brachymonas denitrificans]|uniref:outer membrane protein assembly factor BamE n=1 Tax=Brachymonas denitrificans TaxID=28220 RepID=UPI0020226703|nr:outer membrane protein assembly factor BamE [Brachymonas denitrificans]
MPAQNPARLPRRWLTAASAIALGTALLAGCAVYKPEVLQGNFVSREQVSVLQPGMSREQVRQVLGTPLLTDMFRANRWDYVFTAQHRKGVEPQKYAVAVFFEGDALARIEGAENLPSEAEFVERMSDGKVYKPRNLEASSDKLQSFTDSQKAKAKAKPQPELPAAPSTTSYPALPQ